MFKKGDVVWCTKKDLYGVTDYHVPCVVVEDERNDCILVSTIKSDVEFRFYVTAQYFDNIGVELV